MSNLSEILQNECINTHIIYFYREGVFYKAYDRSAYLFVEVRKALSSKKADGEKCKTGSRLHRLPNQ